jgi:hypothetical protein
MHQFVSKGRISTNFSPFTLLNGQNLDFKKHLALEFEEYCQVHEEEAPRNSEKARTQGPICIGNSGNKQGGFKFMALDSGRKLTRFTWTNLPMPDIVIKRIKEMAKGQPEDLIFTDRKGQLIADDEIPGVDGDENEHPKTTNRSLRVMISTMRMN